MHRKIQTINQLPYDSLDETLFHVVLEDDFGLAKFFNSTTSGGIRGYGR